MLPSLEKFAFIIHPLDATDIFRKFPRASKLPESFLENCFRHLPSFTVSRISGVKSATGAEAAGWFIACPITSRLMFDLPEEYVLRKIIGAAKIAERLGAGIVGLGALTSVVADAGVTIAKNVRIPVTTGNSFTVATALRGIRHACRLMEVELAEANLAVIGATGSIGKACARIMAKQVKELTLVGRNSESLAQLAQEIGRDEAVKVRVSTDISSALSQADVVITVTSAVDTVIKPHYLKSGAIICDVARPRDVSRLVAEARKDVLVFEGGVVQVPGPVNFGLNFGFPPGTAYACMAETMILALEQRYESFSLGRDLSVETIMEIDRLADKHGFKLAGLRSFERALGEEEILAIKQRVKGTRAMAAVSVKF